MQCRGTVQVMVLCLWGFHQEDTADFLMCPTCNQHSRLVLRCTYVSISGCNLSKAEGW